jgi:hypothetical protein
MSMLIPVQVPFVAATFRGYCEYCYDHFKQQEPIQARLSAPFDCDTPFDASDSDRILLIRATMDASGEVSGMSTRFVEPGRPMLGAGSPGGDWHVRVEDTSGVAIFEATTRLVSGVAFLAEQCEGGESALPTEARLELGIPLPDDVDSSSVLAVVVRKDGNDVSRTTINGSPPVADAGPDTVVECSQPGAGSTVLDGRPSSDPDGDTLTYSWSAEGVVFSDDMSATPAVTLPLGSTEISLVVDDGLYASNPDHVTIQVVDTTPPNMELTQMPQFRSCETAPQEVTLELPTVTDMCSPTVAVTGTVVASTNPLVALPLALDGANVTLPVGAHTIRWVGSDSSGNSTTVDQVIEVVPAVYATEHLDLRDRARVVAPSGGYAPVGNFGMELTRVGVEAYVGDIFSQAPVDLRDRAYVQGSVQSAGLVSLGDDVTVTTEIVLEGVPQPTPPAAELDVTFPPEDRGPIHLEPYQSWPIDPGAYATVELKQGATLTLSPGVYFFQSLMLHPEASLELGEGTVEVYVEDSVTHRGSITGSGSLLLGFTGSATVFLESAFAGRLLAPDAEVVIRGDFTGGVIARRLLVDAGETLECVMGAGAGPGGATCSDAEQNGDETDVDCGGPVCPACVEGSGCSVGSDCTSGVCSAGVCQAPACTDAVQNGDETDVDCGGSCPACPDGYACGVDSDCESGICDGGVCQSAPSGSPCTDLCSAPVVFDGPSYSASNLGTGATCHETTAELSGGNCGNFAPGRTLRVNGQTVTCNWSNWPSLPSKRNGGYCFQASAGNYAWAGFTTW